MGPHRFDPAAVAWGVALLDAACPCDILIIDEIGPLEMDRGEGWANALEVLRRGRYRLAVAAVRPSLVDRVWDAVGRGESAEGPAVVCVEAGPRSADELLALLGLVPPPSRLA